MRKHFHNRDSDWLWNEYRWLRGANLCFNCFNGHLKFKSNAEPPRRQAKSRLLCKSKYWKTFRFSFLRFFFLLIRYNETQANWNCQLSNKIFGFCSGAWSVHSHSQTHIQTILRSQKNNKLNCVNLHFFTPLRDRLTQQHAFSHSFNSNHFISILMTAARFSCRCCRSAKCKSRIPLFHVIPHARSSYKSTPPILLTK